MRLPPLLVRTVLLILLIIAGLAVAASVIALDNPHDRSWYTTDA